MFNLCLKGGGSRGPRSAPKGGKKKAAPTVGKKGGSVKKAGAGQSGSDSAADGDAGGPGAGAAAAAAGGSYRSKMSA